MSQRLYVTVLVLGTLICTFAQENYNKLKPNDDIFIDDDSHYGSGDEKTLHSLLDLDASGSGHGPDDEDDYEGSGAILDYKEEEEKIVKYASPKKYGEEVRFGKKAVLTEKEKKVKVVSTDDEEDIDDRFSFIENSDLNNTQLSQDVKNTEQILDIVPVETDKKKKVSPEHTTTKFIFGGDGSELDRSDNMSTDVHVIGRTSDDRPTSFFAQPGILAAVVGGAVVGLLCAILIVMYIVYRMRKKDEGSYPLDEPKRSLAETAYKQNPREFYA